SEENVSGVACPCQPSPRIFSSRLLPAIFAGIWDHALACFVMIPFGSRNFTPCGEEGTRTPDLLLAKQALYQLSYSPAVCRQPCARTWIRTKDLSFIRAAL